jgi:SAM-dependent methyltransferase
MRDVVTSFYCDVLRKQVDAGAIAVSDRVLVVCGGPLDEAVMRDVGFTDFTITGFNHAGAHQDAENLTYGNGSFDVAVVHAGLHHCYSPHRALLEMYRVARKQVLAFESRDSFLMRMAVRLGLTVDYEIDSVIDGKGGAAESGIPNFVYRWTEREVEKVIATFDPTRPPKVDYFYDMRIPIQRFTNSGNRALATAGLAVEPLSRAFATVFPRQCNEFAFVISKTGEEHPWIK